MSLLLFLHNVSLKALLPNLCNAPFAQWRLFTTRTAESRISFFSFIFKSANLSEVLNDKSPNLLEKAKH